MSASRSTYNDMAMDARSTNSITVRHWFGKLHTNKATHLARFFLDEIMGNVDGSGVKGYLGICNVGSPNYNMHAPARRGCLGSGAAGGNGLAFQDGGLNTYGTVGVTSILPGTDGVMVTVSSTSAYYVACSNYGVKWTTTAGNYSGAPSLNQPSGHAENTNDATTFVLEQYMTVGNTVYYKSFHTNTEGTWENTELSFVVPKPMGFYGTDSLYASYAFSDTHDNQLWFSAYSMANGTQVYITVGGTPSSLTGYIANGTSWYHLTSGVIDVIGSVGTWPSGDPANGSSGFTYNWHHKAAGTWEAACSLISAPGNNTPITTFYKNSDGLHYNVEGGSVVSGLYYTSATEFTQIVDGEVAAFGDCTGGFFVY